MKTISRVTYIAVAAFAIVAMAACGSKGKAPEKKKDIKVDTALQLRLQKFVDKPRPQGDFGLYVYDLTAGKPVIDVAGHHSQPSASSIKLLTGTAALNQLGNDFQYHSGMLTNARIQGDTLRGDISFKGDLDPQLQAFDIERMAKEFRNRGVKAFTGKLYVDLLLHEPITAEEHWSPGDLAFSKYGILYRGPETVVKALKQAFRKYGIKFDDKQVTMAPTPKGFHYIFRLNRHIDMVLQRMWNFSANTQATSLLITMGHRSNPKATTIGDMEAAGIGVMKAFMDKQLKPDGDTIVIHDGCGLCHYNSITPYYLCKILRYGYNRKPIYDMLMKCMSVSGYAGTLLHMPKSIKGRIHGKTGTLSHPFGISSLTGFCRGTDGHVLCYALMDSNMSVLDARGLQKELCLALLNAKE